MTRKHLGLTLVLTLVLVACGEAADSGDGEDVTPVLQIRSEGGFAPVEFILGNGPSYTLLSDGHLILRGPEPEAFPRPLVPGYQVVQLADDTVEQIIDLVDKIGLPEMTDDFDDSAASFVADATTEVITLWDDNGVHRYSVYALGIGADPRNPNQPTDPRTVAFADLMEMVAAVDTSAAVGYQPERVRIIAGVAQLAPDRDLGDVRDWPLDGEDPSAWARVNQDWTCQQFGLEVLDDFEGATTVTTWDRNGTEYNLLVRPLLPGEPSCPV